ncbi:dentin sialophospho [Lasius niger]|uniref:Dentin sialophospho n=1 Tax=Lasius niger TaxID=67767 RepID=A0A0J7L1M9_LASNI|nr:dentin sialophospho [Lasius niger]
MPKIPNIRKAKRVSVLTKRAQCLGKHYKERSCRPAYEKLKNNNKFLAKALSQEKQNSRSLFTQNVQLIAENQQLNSTVIANVMNNSKEILKLLLTMSGYITSTLTMCEKLTASTTTVRLSSIPDGRKESSNRLSTKSPAKGVVKPMVSGHTITKPTINLSRVNMETISRLSDIQEVTTPDTQEISENRSSITVSLPSTPLRYENNRTACRMPERLISSPRVNDALTLADEQRRRRRNYHSKRISGSYSRSRNRWSDKTPTTNTRHINVASPTIQLKDISNLLRDSPTVNIRRITDNRIDIENQENSDNIPNNPSERNVISETHMSNPNEETHTQAQKKECTNEQISSKIPDKGLNKIPNVIENSRLSQNNTRNWGEEDPLEGPSWLFNNTIPSRDNEPEELNLHVSDVNNNTSQLIVYDDESSSAESNTEELSPLQNLNESVSDIQVLDTDATPIADRTGYESYLRENNEGDDSFCELSSANVFNRKGNLNNIEDNAEDNTRNFARFVTLRREDPEVTEDFTLMLSRLPIQNMQFDINELRLPDLEESTMNSIGNRIDTEVTAARLSVANNSISFVSNQTLNESEHDETAMIKLPEQNKEKEQIAEQSRSKHGKSCFGEA